MQCLLTALQAILPIVHADNLRSLESDEPGQHRLLSGG